MLPEHRERGGGSCWVEERILAREGGILTGLAQRCNLDIQRCSKNDIPSEDPQEGSLR